VADNGDITNGYLHMRMVVEKGSGERRRPLGEHRPDGPDRESLSLQDVSGEVYDGAVKPVRPSGLPRERYPAGPTALDE
jgi:hypothetical protein